MPSETETTQGATQAPPSRDRNSSEELPNDIDSLRAKIAALEHKAGEVLNENKRIKTSNQKLSEALKSWNDIAAEHQVEADQVKALLASREEADLQKARSQGEIDKLLENQRKRYEKELAAVQEQRKKDAALIEELTVNSTLRAELNKVVEPKLLNGAFKLLRDKVISVEDPEAQYGMRIVATVGGEHMPIEDYIRQWAESDAEAEPYLKPSLAAGGGAGGAKSVLMGLKPRSKMTTREKSQFIEAKGRDAYLALPY
jgi:regulator of replication initiation timing